MSVVRCIYFNVHLFECNVVSQQCTWVSHWAPSVTMWVGETIKSDWKFVEHLCRFKSQVKWSVLQLYRLKRMTSYALWAREMYLELSSAVCVSLLWVSGNSFCLTTLWSKTSMVRTLKLWLISQRFQIVHVNLLGWPKTKKAAWFEMYGLVCYKALLTHKSLSNQTAFCWSALNSSDKLENEQNLHWELFHPNVNLPIALIPIRINQFWQRNFAE